MGNHRRCRNGTTSIPIVSRRRKSFGGNDLGRRGRGRIDVSPWYQTTYNYLYNLLIIFEIVTRCVTRMDDNIYMRETNNSKGNDMIKFGLSEWAAIISLYIWILYMTVT